MGQVKELIEKNKFVKGVTKRTKNDDLLHSIIVALANDEEYVVKEVTNIENGQIVTEDRHIATEVREVVANILAKMTSMTKEEALEAAKSYTLSKKDAKALNDLVYNAGYICMKDCGKKVQFVKNDEMNVLLSVSDVGERVRPFPKDKEKGTKTKAHKKIKAELKLYPHQKEKIDFIKEHC